MTTAKAPPQYESGHCQVGAHERCRGAYAGVVCCCPHHTEPPVVTVHCALGCAGRHVETGTDPQAVHDVMEAHYRTAHARRVQVRRSEVWRTDPDGSWRVIGLAERDGHPDEASAVVALLAGLGIDAGEYRP